MPTRDTPWPNGTPCWVDYGAADLDADEGLLRVRPRLGVHRRRAGVRRLPDRDRGRPDGRRHGPAAGPERPAALDDVLRRRRRRGDRRTIKDAGGTVVVEPMEVGPMGTMVIALDPQGNPFGLWQSGVQHRRPDPQRARRAGLERGDGRRHRGGQARSTPPSSGSPSTRWTPRRPAAWTTRRSRPDGDPLGGLGASDPAMPKGWLTCFAVSSTDEAVATVEAKGGKVDDAADGHPVRPVRHRRGPVGRAVRGDADPPRRPEHGRRAGDRAGPGSAGQLAVGVLGPEPDDEAAVGDHRGPVLVPVLVLAVDPAVVGDQLLDRRRRAGRRPPG